MQTNSKFTSLFTSLFTSGPKTQKCLNGISRASDYFNKYYVSQYHVILNHVIVYNMDN